MDKPCPGLGPAAALGLGLDGGDGGGDGGGGRPGGRRPARHGGEHKEHREGPEEKKRVDNGDSEATCGVKAAGKTFAQCTQADVLCRRTWQLYAPEFAMTMKIPDEGSRNKSDPYAIGRRLHARSATTPVHRLIINDHYRCVAWGLPLRCSTAAAAAAADGRLPHHGPTNSRLPPTARRRAARCARLATRRTHARLSSRDPVT